MTQESETFEQWRERTAPRGWAWRWRTARISAGLPLANALFFFVVGEPAIALLLVALAALEIAQVAVEQYVPAHVRAVARKVVGWGALFAVAILAATDQISTEDLIVVGAVAFAALFLEAVVRVSDRWKARRAEQE